MITMKAAASLINEESFKVNSKPAGPAGYSLAALILTATAQHALLIFKE